MPAKRRYDRDRGLVEFEWEGDISVDDVIEEEADFFAKESVHGSLKILSDFTAIETIDFSRQRLTEMIEQDEEVISSGVDVRCAIVAGDNRVFGLSRMFELLSGDRAGEVSVFRDPDEARRWLLDD